MLDRLDEPPATGVATVVLGDLPHGFVADQIKLALFTAGDLSGQRTADKATRKMPVRRKIGSSAESVADRPLPSVAV